MTKFEFAVAALKARRVIQPTWIGLTALVWACDAGPTVVEPSCGGPLQLAAVEDAMAWTTSVRTELIQSIIESNPDDRYQAVSAEVVRLSDDLDRMATAHGVLDQGGWCDEECEGRGAAFNVASAELRGRLTAAQQERDVRAAELHRAASNILDSSVSYQFGEVEMLGAGGATGSITCEVALIAVLPSGERVERRLIYTPSLGDRFVDVLSVN